MLPAATSAEDDLAELAEQQQRYRRNQADRPLLQPVSEPVPNRSCSTRNWVISIEPTNAQANAQSSFGLDSVDGPERALLGEAQVERDGDVHQRQAHEGHCLADLE